VLLCVKCPEFAIHKDIRKLLTDDKLEVKEDVRMQTRGWYARGIYIGGNEKLLKRISADNAKYLIVVCWLSLNDVHLDYQDSHDWCSSKLEEFLITTDVKSWINAQERRRVCKKSSWKMLL